MVIFSPFSTIIVFLLNNNINGEKLKLKKEIISHIYSSHEIVFHF